jgi:hypothetical protein
MVELSQDVKVRKKRVIGTTFFSKKKCEKGLLFHYFCFLKESAKKGRCFITFVFSKKVPPYIHNQTLPTP